MACCLHDQAMDDPEGPRSISQQALRGRVRRASCWHLCDVEAGYRLFTTPPELCCNLLPIPASLCSYLVAPTHVGEPRACRREGTGAKGETEWELGLCVCNLCVCWWWWWGV